MLPSSLPAPRLIDPSSVTPLRWGIIGPGGIAETFADSVHKHTTQRIVAVASQTPGKADAFATPRGIAYALSSYDALVNHPEVDVVYVATTHQFHKEHALLAIAAGKHVLVEKPLATNPTDAQEIVDAAAAAGVLAMEALWTRYIPQSDVMRQIFAEGILGDISLVISDFGQDLRHVPRLMDPVAGGGLLDLGIYNFAFSSFVLGNATSISTVGSLTSTGVDETTTSVLSYASGAHAVATVSMAAFTPTAASVSGSLGRLNIHEPFFVPSGLTLFSSEFNPAPVASWRDETGVPAHEGLSYQATALASFVDQGLTDSPLRPLAEAVNDNALIYQARHHIGAILNGEK